MNERGARHTLTCMHTHTELPMLHVSLIKWQLALLRPHHPPYRPIRFSWYKLTVFWQYNKNCNETALWCLFLLWFYQKWSILIQHPNSGFETKNTGLGGCETMLCSGLSSHNGLSGWQSKVMSHWLQRQKEMWHKQPNLSEKLFKDS